MRLLIVVAIIAVSHPSSAQQQIFGEWRVTGSLCPGDCALTPAQRDAWHGRPARYSSARAQFGESACTAPRYVVAWWPQEGRYGGATLAQLGIPADSAMVIDVECLTNRGSGVDLRWQAPGGFIIMKDRDHLLAVWEGAFFELRRQ